MDHPRWARIQELYAAASEQPESERSRFLSVACEGDEALEREVKTLLDQPTSTAQFVEFVGGPPAARRLDDYVDNFSGRQLGRYTFVSLLGRGGMGEVYRAHDSRLGRDVAIKLLPAEFTEDAGRLARFETEARALAALNHPHIAAIYGIEDAGGVPALVLELVDGETLADRLQRSALSVAEALPLARQMADALDAAHRKGIVHRDLKPANVKITSDGVAKVLDFGLAKAVSAPVDSAVTEYQQLTDFADSAHAPSLSPDGRMVAFKVGDNFFLGPGQIYVKLLPNGESVPLTRGRPSSTFGPVFTPDGSRVAYSAFTANSWDTFTVPVLGGEPTRLLPNASGLTYLADGRVLFAEIRGGLHMGIVSAQPNRAEPHDIYFPPHQLGMAHFAQASPDGKSVILGDSSRWASISTWQQARRAARSRFQCTNCGHCRRCQPVAFTRSSTMRRWLAVQVSSPCRTADRYSAAHRTRTCSRTRTSTRISFASR